MKNNNGNDSCITIIAQAISEMEAEQGKSLSADEINLAELERRTGITRARLRRLKSNNFKPMPHGRLGQHAEITVLSSFTGALDNLLRQGVTNSSVCLERLQEMGYPGGQTQIKEYISKHKDLVPAKRQMVDPQGNRGFRYHISSSIPEPIRGSSCRCTPAVPSYFFSTSAILVKASMCDSTV